MIGYDFVSLMAVLMNRHTQNQKLVKEHVRKQKIFLNKYLGRLSERKKNNRNGKYHADKNRARHIFRTEA